MSTTQFMPHATIHLHQHDLPETVCARRRGRGGHRDHGPQPASRPAVPGAAFGRRRARASGAAHPDALGGHGYDCPNLKRLLADPAVVKLMHFARFDVAVLQHALGITVAPVNCTKIAAKLVRTFTDRHGLKDLCRELLGVELSKQQQTSDWGAAGADAGAAGLCRLRRAAPACAVGEAGGAAGARESAASWPMHASPSCPPAAGWTCSATSSRTFSRIDRARFRAHCPALAHNCCPGSARSGVGFR